MLNRMQFCWENCNVRIIELFTQKIVTMLSKIWVWYQGSEIQDPENPYSGSRGQKGTGSRIRIATLSDTLILTCRLKSVISTKLSHIESWFFLTVFSTHTPCQSEKLVRLELKRQLRHFFKKLLSFHLSEEVKYKYDELKIKSGT